jgi:hypothetical protein
MRRNQGKVGVDQAENKKVSHMIRKAGPGEIIIREGETWGMEVSPSGRVSKLS